MARAHALVKAARALAAERRSTEFTVLEVVERAGVSLRTFYRQFSSKDDLIVALFEEEARQGTSLLEEAMASLADPLARLERYIVGLWTLTATGSGYASTLVREHLRLGERHPAVLRQALSPLVNLLQQTLQAAADAGEIRPVEPTDAVLIISSVLAHVHASILIAPDDDQDRAASALWRIWKLALTPLPPTA